jgi:ketosteroid isomerase-like protein
MRAFHGVHRIQSNVDVVRSLFERFAASGAEGTLEGIDEDVVIEIPPEMSAEPDDYHGHGGVRRYFAGWDGMIEDLRYEAVELHAIGDRVIAHARMSGRGVTSGLDVELDAFVLHELRYGKVTRMRPYPDMESARAAAGL